MPKRVTKEMVCTIRFKRRMARLLIHMSIDVCPLIFPVTCNMGIKSVWSKIIDISDNKIYYMLNLSLPIDPYIGPQLWIKPI